MNIIFLSLLKIDDVEENGIYTDLLRKMRDEGHSVYIVSPTERRYQKPTKLVKNNGISLLNVSIGNITKTNSIEKGISTLTIGRAYKNAITKHFNNIKFDLILYTTPPITIVNVIEYLKQRDNAKTYLLLKDIFPQNAVDLNMINNKGIMYKHFRNQEKKLYDVSDHIGTMSPANSEYLLANNLYVDPNKVELCPNTITPININIKEEQLESIRTKYNVPIDKTVYIYGGNLGKPQGIDFLIECIKENEFNTNTFILIVGSGTEFNKLEKYFNNEKPTNAKLLNALPKKEYELLVNSSDVGLIFLDYRFTIPNFPSRLLSYMQASMPVIAVTDTATDIGKIIENGGFGYWSKSGNVKGFNDNILKMNKTSDIEKFGESARRYLENNYTTEHAYKIIMNRMRRG